MTGDFEYQADELSEWAFPPLSPLARKIFQDQERKRNEQHRDAPEAVGPEEE